MIGFICGEFQLFVIFQSYSGLTTVGATVVVQWLVLWSHHPAVAGLSPGWVRKDRWAWHNYQTLHTSAQAVLMSDVNNVCLFVCSFCLKTNHNHVINIKEAGYSHHMWTHLLFFDLFTFSMCYSVTALIFVSVASCHRVWCFLSASLLPTLWTSPLLRHSLTGLCACSRCPLVVISTCSSTSSTSKLMTVKRSNYY